MKRLAALSLLVVAVTTATADEARMRALLAQLDYETIVQEVESQQAPLTSPVERALYVHALARAGAVTRASSEAAKLREEHAENPWSWYATVAASESQVESLASSEKMMTLAGDAPDPAIINLRAQALSDGGKRAEALALLEQQPRTATSLVAQARLRGYMRGPKDPADPKIQELLAEARALDRENVEAHYLAALFLRIDQQLKEALPHAERAAALTTAARVHKEHWDILRGIKRDETAAAIEAALARSSQPRLLYSAADVYYELGNKDKHAELQARILNDAPKSITAQWVLADRQRRADRKDGSHIARAREYIHYPHHYEPFLKANAYRQLFFALKESPKDAKEVEVLEALRGMRPIAHRQPASDMGGAAIFLADNKWALDEAEKLAREGLVAVERYLEEARHRSSNFEELSAFHRGTVHDALGWVLLQRGKKTEAQKALLEAWNLFPKSPQIAFHLGRLYESQKKLTKAEEMYRKGFLMQSAQVNPNADALKTLYKKRYGSDAGWDEYLKSAKAADTESRRKSILAARTSKALPPFTLKTVDGKTMSTDDLKGKITVINFWGIWCGWCVREMPEFQELVKKYGKDEKVAILTINNDNDAEKVRRWMAEKKYEFPVLLDDRYGRGNVGGYPTTWFIDPTGKIAFEKLGWSERLIEEFSWRIEALR